MPSKKNRRNRKMKKLQAQANSPPAENTPTIEMYTFFHHFRLAPCSSKSLNRKESCSICNGSKCKNSFLYTGSCGCKFGECCFDGTYINDCPTCRLKFLPTEETPMPIDRFNDGMVQAGELAAVLVEELACKASNAIMSWSENSACHNNRPLKPMSKHDRDAVIRDVRVYSAVAETAAVVTGGLANAVGGLLWTVGSALSPVVRHVAKKILTSNDVEADRAETMVDNAMKFGTAAVLTTANVVRGVQSGTGILASGVGSSMARIYESNHGFQPGELHSDVGNIAANITATTWNVKALGTGTASKLTKMSKIPLHNASKSNSSKYQKV